VPARTSRNILAAMMITAGMLMLISSPLSAVDHGQVCATFTINFDDQGEGSLRKQNTSIGPVAIDLPAGVYDIVMTSFDPTHGPGLFVDQLNESWFFTLDNGYTSPTTPDFGDSEPGVSILVPSVALDAATAVTAQWAGVLPSSDSVHATVSFTCARQTIPTTAPTTTAGATTSPTTAAPATSSTVPQSSTTVAASTSTVDPGASSTTMAALLPTTMAPTTQLTSPPTTVKVGEIGGTTEQNPELAFTGMKINLAIGGISLVAAGFGLITLGAYTDRRRVELAVR